MLQALFVALLVGFALQAMGSAGEPILRGIEHLQKLVFKVLVMILWLAPIGAFGAIANVVGQTGWTAVTQLLTLMLGFYITCVMFVFGVLGTLLRVVSGVSIFKLVRYLAREYLLIFSTSSSESALPRLIAKMEHLGVDRSTVGVVVPTGYSFNLDGTAIYLTMASLFIADAMGNPLSVGEQIGLLVFMIVASKGAAGVTGAGLAMLAGGLQSHRPDLLDGVGLIVGIDRFMSEARAVTNFSGNAVATLLVGSWTKTIDKDKVDAVLRGDDPFDELQRHCAARRRERPYLAPCRRWVQRGAKPSRSSRSHRPLKKTGSVTGREQPGELLWQRYGAARVRVDGGKGDNPVGDNRAIAPHDPLCQSEAGTAAPLRPGDDPQPVALVAGLPEVEADVHHHRDRPQPLEAVVSEAVALVPLLATPFQVLDELRVVDVAVDVDLGAAHDRLQDHFHVHRFGGDLLRHGIPSFASCCALFREAE